VARVTLTFTAKTESFPEDGLDAVPDPSTGLVDDFPPSGNRSATMAGNSLSGGFWTAVSRITGVGKVIAIGAVLGATYLGNTYQATNSIPNLIYYQILAGSLFASLLVPPLVRHLAARNPKGAAELAGRFFGVVLLGAAVLAVAIAAAGPLILKVLAVGVDRPGLEAVQQRVGWSLLAMFVPQIALYAVAGTCAAVMNAHGRFALAAGAPALESLGMIATMVANAIIFGRATNLADVGGMQLLLIGLGTTASVALHASVQWIGARRCGTTLVPRAGWRDPEVREILHRMIPTLGYTGLTAAQLFAMTVVANSVAGGVIAFQLALNFFFLPSAIATWPVARAMLPQLSELHIAGLRRRFSEELTSGLQLALFLTLPIGLGYVGLAAPLARALAFGKLATPFAQSLLTLSLAALGVGVISESIFVLGTYAFFSKKDARTPLKAMVVRVCVLLVGMFVGLKLHGSVVLVVVGGSFSASGIAGAIYLLTRLDLAGGLSSFLWRLVKMAVSSTMAVAAGYAAVSLCDRLLPGSHIASIVALLVGVVVATACFLAIEGLSKAPELRLLMDGLLHLRGSTRASESESVRSAYDQDPPRSEVGSE
jgi:putative peptidoglycan lipid II flippase